jgi:hypothetical protein
MSDCADAQRGKENLLSFNSRVKFVGVGFITLERALPYNVSRTWSAAFHSFDRKQFIYHLLPGYASMSAAT